MSIEKILSGTLEEVWDEINNYYKMLNAETDRGAAVLALAVFEDELRKAIESHDEAFKGSGLKLRVNTEIAYALGLYDRKTRDGLLTVARIRNEFAHSRQPLQFSDAKIVEIWRQFRPIDDPADLRETYLSFLREVELDLPAFKSLE